MMRLAALLMLVLALAACGGPLSLLTGGGPNVAANVQAGKTNSQTIGQTKNTSQKLVRPQARSIEQSTGETRVRTERVETIIVQEQVPPWIWISWAVLFAAAVVGWIHGWLTPSPRERRLMRRQPQ